MVGVEDEERVGAWILGTHLHFSLILAWLESQIFALLKNHLFYCCPGPLFNCNTSRVDFFHIDILVFDISVVKVSQICYYYWFSGRKKQWLRSLHIVMKCRSATFSLNIKSRLNAMWWLTGLLFDCVYQCTVLEVKVIEGHGTTIDVVLVNGVLHEGDQIVVCGMQASVLNSICIICYYWLLLMTNKNYIIGGTNCYLNSSFIDTSSNEGTPY